MSDLKSRNGLNDPGDFQAEHDEKKRQPGERSLPLLAREMSPVLILGLRHWRHAGMVWGETVSRATTRTFCVTIL